jgi:hypothetical protein
VFDSAKKIVFKTDDEVPAIMLMVMGESREAMMRDGGLIEASETVNFFGKAPRRHESGAEGRGTSSKYYECHDVPLAGQLNLWRSRRRKI